LGAGVMDADWSVELGSEDAALEFPWSSPDGSQRYIDLQAHPERLTDIPEATLFPELGELLRAINQMHSSWRSAKCDVWLDDELGEAEAIYSAKLKLCSYVDLVACEEAARFSFERHEHWVKSVAHELSSEDATPVACELMVRRCWYHTETSSLRAGDDAATPGETNPVPGFYVTLYLFGYGDDEAQARARWAEGLQHVTTVLSEFAP
jgi:hypothetical protein